MRYTSPSTFSNITAAGESVLATGSGAQYVGGLVGYNGALISNDTVTGAVSAGDYATSVGGLVGDNHSGMVQSSAFIGTLIAGDNAIYIGGLSGLNEDQTITVGLLRPPAVGKISASTISGTQIQLTTSASGLQNLIIGLSSETLESRDDAEEDRISCLKSAHTSPECEATIAIKGF